MIIYNYLTIYSIQPFYCIVLKSYRYVILTNFMNLLHSISSDISLFYALYALVSPWPFSMWLRYINEWLLDNAQVFIAMWKAVECINDDYNYAAVCRPIFTTIPASTEWKPGWLRRALNPLLPSLPSTPVSRLRDSTRQNPSPDSPSPRDDLGWWDSRGRLYMLYHFPE